MGKGGWERPYRELWEWGQPGNPRDGNSPWKTPRNRFYPKGINAGLEGKTDQGKRGGGKKAKQEVKKFRINTEWDLCAGITGKGADWETQSVEKVGIAGNKRRDNGKLITSGR